MTTKTPAKHPNCAERCQIVENKGYRPCEGDCFYADPRWPLQGFNAVLAALADTADYCECGAVHSGIEDMGRCEACGKVI